MLSLKSALSSCALFALAAVPGFSTVITYNDLTSFQSATSGLSTLTFEGLETTPGSQKDYSNSNGLNATNLGIPGAPTFVGNNNGGYYLQVIDPTPGSFFDYGSGSSLYWNQPSLAYLQITFQTAVTAVGFNFMVHGDHGIDFSVKLNGQPTAYPTGAFGAWPNAAYFGITSDTPIASLQLSQVSGGTPMIDNFSFGAEDQAQTPELCTFLLIASGLIGLRLFRGRLRGLAGLPA